MPPRTRRVHGKVRHQFMLTKVAWAPGAHFTYITYAELKVHLSPIVINTPHCTRELEKKSENKLRIFPFKSVPSKMLFYFVY